MEREQEPRGGIPPISYGERHDIERLPAGYYSYPVRGPTTPNIDDYTRLGDLKGSAIAPEQLIPLHQLADDSPK